MLAVAGRPATQCSETLAAVTDRERNISGDQHFERLIGWLDMESKAEIMQLEHRRRRGASADAENSGETLLDLVITQHEPELGGRTRLTFVKRNRTLRLPWNRLRVGAPVVLSPDGPGKGSQHGVVSARSGDSIEVSVEDWPHGERFRLDLSSDSVTRKRQTAALQAAAQARGRTGTLRQTLLGERTPQFAKSPSLTFAAPLNPSQQEALCFALSALDVAIIQGPPGTGNATTVVELIGQAIDLGQKVLVSAPSNTAVDNILERLVAAGRRVVRLGHPARVDEQLRSFTLDAQVAAREETAIVRDMLRESAALFHQMNRYTRAKPAPGAKQEMRREALQLKSDARLLEEVTVQSVLDRADVVCSTTTVNDELLGERRFACSANMVGKF